MGESTVYRNALELSTTLGEYQLKSVLGAGGFGMTYLAWDANLEKHVAIKEYLPGDLAVRALDGSVVPVSTDHQHDYRWGLDRFIQEARTLARFSHPHIVRVNRYFESNGTGYMVMDYEEGESLNQWLKRAPLPAEAELRRILLPLLDGLAAVHAAKFLHRDIKPSNIFIRSGGSPVLLDFGAARATGSGTRSMTAVLTPGYAPLEQYGADGKQGPWSDIYAMGGVLFRAVTDRNPPDAVSRLQGDSVSGALAAARSRYSPPFLRAIEQALAIKPELRPQAVLQWKNLLEAQQPALPASPAPAAGAKPETVAAAATTRNSGRAAPSRAAASPRDHSAAWRRIGWTVALLIGGALALGWHKRRPEPPPAPEPVAKVQPKRAPVQVEVVPMPPGTASASGAVIVRPLEEPVPPPPEGAARAAVPATPQGLPGRDLPAGADSRERLPRPDGSPQVPERVKERVHDEFRLADRDGDGFLSAAEVEGRFPFVAREFGRVDRDGDRRISLDEFVALRRMQAEGFKPPKPPKPHFSQ